jgi:hypothetical protein
MDCRREAKASVNYLAPVFCRRRPSSSPRANFFELDKKEIGHQSSDAAIANPAQVGCVSPSLAL